MSNAGGHPFGMVMWADFFDRTLIFGCWSSGEDDWCRNRGGGGRYGCGGGCKGGLSKFGGTVGSGCIGVADGLE